jgi:hypothetical protein
MKKIAQTAERPKLRQKARGIFPRLFKLSRNAPDPSLEVLREEARRRIRAKRGIFASLSPEEREEILSYDGPEFLGNPDSKFRL